MPVQVQARELQLRLMPRGDRPARLLEHGHETVAHALDDAAIVRVNGGADELIDAAQQLQRERVPRLERPLREVDEIGEHDRHLAVAVAAALRLREPLPQLQGAKAQLAHHARALGPHRRELPGEQIRRAGRRERIAEAAVARQPLPRAPRRGEQRRVGVQAPGGCRQARDSALARAHVRARRRVRPVQRAVGTRTN